MRASGQTSAKDSREMHDAEVCTSPQRIWSKDHAEAGTTHREPARSGDAEDGEEGAKVYTARGCAAAGTLSTTVVFCSASASFTRLVLGRFGRLGVSLDLLLVLHVLYTCAPRWHVGGASPDPIKP